MGALRALMFSGRDVKDNKQGLISQDDTEEMISSRAHSDGNSGGSSMEEAAQPAMEDATNDGGIKYCFCGRQMMLRCFDAASTTLVLETVCHRY